jgi:hypothetical protein
VGALAAASRQSAPHLLAWSAPALAEHTLYQNFADIVRMVFHYAMRTRQFRTSEAEGHAYEAPSKRQRDETRAQHHGRLIAEQGRVQCCPPEAFCGAQLEVWSVLHEGKTELGQRVTRLQGKFFCDCNSFVERVLQCEHVCAVVEREAMAAAGKDQPEGPDNSARALLSKKPKDIAKRGRPPHSYRRRHIAKGTRVLVKTRDEES